MLARTRTSVVLLATNVRAWRPRTRNKRGNNNHNKMYQNKKIQRIKFRVLGRISYVLVYHSGASSSYIIALLVIACVERILEHD
jgi:hypothetical protein